MSIKWDIISQFHVHIDDKFDRIYDTKRQKVYYDSDKGIILRSFLLGHTHITQFWHSVGWIESNINLAKVGFSSPYLSYTCIYT